MRISLKNKFLLAMVAVSLSLLIANPALAKYSNAQSLIDKGWLGFLLIFAVSFAIFGIKIIAKSPAFKNSVKKNSIFKKMDKNLGVKGFLLALIVFLGGLALLGWYLKWGADDLERYHQELNTGNVSTAPGITY